MRLFQFASILLFASSSLFAADGASARLYLALGDSVSFGFIANAGFEYLNPQNFVGFPITSARRASSIPRMAPVLERPPTSFCPSLLPMTDAVFIARKCHYTSATLPRNWISRSLS